MENGDVRRSDLHRGRTDRGSTTRTLIWLAAAIAVTALFSLIRPSTAWGAEPVPGSATTTTTTAPIPAFTFATTSPVLVETRPSFWSARIVLTITTACPHQVWFWIVLPSNKTVPSSVTSSSISCSSTNWQVLTKEVAFSASFTTPPAATTLVASEYPPTGPATTTGGGATTIELTTQTALPGQVELFWPFASAAGFALLFAIWVVARELVRLRWVHWRVERLRQFGPRQKAKKRRQDNPLGPKPRLSSVSLYASASWTFKDSWATNIVAVGAVFGTFLTAAGTVTTLFPGVPLYRFSILSALCGGIVVMAPLVVGVANFRRRNQQRGMRAPGNAQSGDTLVSSLLAVILGGIVTMFATGAELALLGLLIHLSAARSAPTDALLAIDAAAAAIIFFYAVSTTQTLILSSEQDRTDAARVGSALSRFGDSSFTL